ncbi:Glu/Leu/Phe/Val family dehydrogenase [Rhodohalobacter mucosus]|uniref:Leucine dehydrogenase n=1 Tax=Rhodohalobacter mucosus TaxID=2079485 RepID=A0A316TU26_9BACT|nr:Glu/Leu/Phe/Val dehydrogenase [Rhodohalobacter mucosus]PWN05802.1 leucine dehydrogenase [Rhodohalobacter mucosus]
MNDTINRVETGAKVNKDFELFSDLQNMEHEQIVFCSRPEVGLKAIIAIHDTTLGPSLGGVRMWNYSSEKEAIRDVLRLSRGMTYKSAISGLNLGGGKAVIIGDSRTQKSEGLFRAFGRFVDGLSGRYITAEDVGISEREMEWIFTETKYVTGIPKHMGGSGNPSPVTGYGVYMGMKAAAKRAYGSDSLEGKRIAIQGAGSVASHLANYVSKENAALFVTDIFPEKAKKIANETGATIVDPDAIYTLDMDIFSPCALGGVVNDDTINVLSCDIVAGGANNILDNEEKHGEMLVRKGILYAPDYVINAGGIINVASELEGYNEQQSMEKTSRIYDTTLQIFDYAEKNGIPTIAASNKLADERIKAVAGIKTVYSSKSHFSGRKGETYLRNRS